MEATFSNCMPDDLPKSDKKLEEMHIVGQIIENDIVYFQLRGPATKQTQWRYIRDLLARAYFPPNNLWVNDIRKVSNREVKIVPKKTYYLNDIMSSLHNFVGYMKDAEEHEIALTNGDVRFRNFTLVVGEFNAKLSSVSKPKPIKKKTAKAKRARKARPRVEYTKKYIRQLEARCRRLERENKKLKESQIATIGMLDKAKNKLLKLAKAA